MKKEITTTIIGLLLLLSTAAAAQDAGNPGDVPGQAAGSQEAQASGPEDLAGICSERRVQAKEGDFFTFCNVDLEVSALDGDRITVNGKEIMFGDKDKLDGLEVSYEEFADDAATIALSTKFDKKLESKFEENRFKLFYDDDAKFAGPADARREALAEIIYGANKAKIMIRSATREQLMLGIDFDNGTLTEKLNLPFSMEHTKITALKSDEISSDPEQPELFQYEVEQGAVRLTLGNVDYMIAVVNDVRSTDRTVLTVLLANAIAIGSEEGSLILFSGTSQKDTNKLYIGTRLAKSTPAELACSYDIDSSIDDFSTRARVQGYYPASPEKFFDVFTDYCVDDSTLINYGCAGLKNAWEQTSRVAFLEVGCGCSDGICERGPYCIDSDKHAQAPKNVKGKVVILDRLGRREAYTEATPGYTSGRKKFKDATVKDDTCKDDKTVTEYKCDLTAPEGFSASEETCEGVCDNGACVAAPTEVTPEDTTAQPPPEEITAQPLPEDLSALRSELIKLENLIGILQDTKWLPTAPGDIATTTTQPVSVFNIVRSRILRFLQ